MAVRHFFVQREGMRMSTFFDGFDTAVNDRIKKPETQEEWQARMGAQIIEYLKGEIYLDLPYLDIALSALEPRGNAELMTYATDGVFLYFGPEHQIGVFRSNERFLMRAYLHTVLHCIYAHLWIGGTRERILWNLACDMAVESVIDQLDKPCTKRILSFQRKKLYDWMKKEQIVSAAELYEALYAKYAGVVVERKEEQGKTDEADRQELLGLLAEFAVDDHRFWPKEEKEKKKMIKEAAAQDKWQQAARQMQLKRDQRGKEADLGQKLLLSNAKTPKKQRSYAEFLKKFTKLREEIHLNADEFDLSYYTYGLSHYGNIPLIEPLETKEEKRIRELVIVIDTSYSTSGELVKGFIRETFAILNEKQAFFKQNRVHILQCDDAVRKDTLVTSENDVKRLLSDFELTGGGNTDFRPAFAYVEHLMEKGSLTHPGGLLYFTDGKGIYPKKRPAYPCAFLFLGGSKREAVPAWAMQLCVEQEELRRAGTGKRKETRKTV